MIIPGLFNEMLMNNLEKHLDKKYHLLIYGHNYVYGIYHIWPSCLSPLATKLLVFRSTLCLFYVKEVR